MNGIQGGLLVLLACTPKVLVGSDTPSVASLTAIEVSSMCPDTVSAVRATVITEPETHCARWLERTLTYHFDSNGTRSLSNESVFKAINQAFATWQTAANACSDLRFVEGARLAAPRVTHDGRNVIVFRDQKCDGLVPASDPCWADLSCRNTYDCWVHETSVAAMTTLSYTRSTGVLLDADLEFNASEFLLTAGSVGAPCEPPANTNCVGFDVQAIATHEIGHLLGLSHSPAPESTMEPTLVLGDLSKALLDNGTRCFVCSVYPIGEATLDCAL